MPEQGNVDGDQSQPSKWKSVWAVLAGFVSGELARSAAYLLVDATEAFGTGALTVVALTSVSSWRR